MRPASDASRGVSPRLLVMTEFAGCSLRIQKVSFYRDTSHIAQARPDRECGFCRIVALMAIEAATSCKSVSGDQWPGSPRCPKAHTTRQSHSIRNKDA